MPTTLAAHAWHCMAPQRIVIIYDRISKDQTGAREAVGNQQAANRKVAAGYAPDQVIEYADSDKSASDRSVVRPDFQRLLRDVQSGMYDGALIIAWAQDRFLRDDIEYATTVRLLNEHNIRFIAPKDGVDLTPEGGGEMMSGIRQLFAAEEIRKIKKRLALKMEANRTAGRRHGKLPFGWRPDGTLEPEQAGMVRDAAERLLRGETLAAIAAEWNTTGRPKLSFTKRSAAGQKLAPEDQVTVVNDWSANRLSQLLRRPANAGVMMHNGARLDVEAQWQPILSEEQWTAVRGKLLARSPRVNPVRRHLLSGLIVCARDDCGGPMWGVTNRSEGHEYVVYRCGTCNQLVKVAPVDAYVQRLVVARLASLAPSELVDAGRKDEMDRLTERIAMLKGRLADTNDRYADIDREDTIDSGTHAQLVATLSPALAKAEAKRDRLIEAEGSGAVLAGLIGPGADAAWRECSRDRKRAVIALLVELYLCPGDRFTPVEERIDARLRRSLASPAR